MTNFEIGTKLVALCKEGKNEEALNTLYSDNIVSVEAAKNQEMPRQIEGIGAVREKNQWWMENHEVHSGDVQGPFPHGEDRFATIFNYDVTFKPANQRMKLEEIAVYSTSEGKITREEFYYQMG